MSTSSSKHKFGSIFPKSIGPSRTLYLADLTTERYDEHFALRVLQGIVARKQPSIFLTSAVRDAHPVTESSCPDLDDGIWVERLRTLGYEFERVENPLDLVRIYRHEISGAVLYEDRGEHSINLALMLAAQMDAIPCTPALARILDLPVVFDTIDKWATAAEAYNWALTNLWEDCNQDMIATSPAHYFNMMDYLAQHKVFTCHLMNYASPFDKEVFSSVLRRLPVGSPVIGVWDLRYAKFCLDPERDYERIFIDTVSEHGHFFVVTHDCGNLSMHTGMGRATVRAGQTRVRPQTPGKTYLSFIFSEGDNITFQMRNRPVIWEDPARGSVPITWAIAPSMLELCPVVFDYYEESRTENDSWIVATSGIGYFMPERIGRLLNAEEREESFERICDLTDQAMSELGVSCLWVLDHRITGSDFRTEREYVVDRHTLSRMLERIPAVESVFCDYPDMFDKRSFDPKQYMIGDVPVLHARTCYDPNKTIVQQLREFREDTDSPPFVFVFVSGWAESPSTVKQYMDELGDDFSAVSASELAAMYASWETAKSGMLQEIGR